MVDKKNFAALLNLSQGYFSCFRNFLFLKVIKEDNERERERERVNEFEGDRKKIE